jgi:hypothetical protein
MGDIDVGGDSSVKWSINADGARPGNVHSNPDPQPGKPNRHHQRGIDETAVGQYFTISIEVPAGLVERNNLASALHSAADTVAAAVPGSGARASFNLPIEQQNENQIEIRWNSRV